MLLFLPIYFINLIVLYFIIYLDLLLNSTQIYINHLAFIRISLIFIMGVLLVVDKNCLKNVDYLYRNRNGIIVNKLLLFFIILLSTLEFK